MRLVSRFLLAVTCLVVCLVASPVHAQGTSGQLPDPMSTTDLSKLLDLYVKPTIEQRATIESLHDDYREQFRTLREGDIQKSMDKMALMQGGMPTKEQMDSFTKGFDKVQRQIADIDDGLFEAIATLVGDDRRPAVNRARDARSRRRATTGLSGGLMGGQSLPDLSAIVLAADLDPETLAAIEPALLTYEQRLTAGTKELGTLGMRMLRDMFDEMEQAGLGNMSQEEMMQDPEKMQAVMEVAQAAIKKASARFQAKAKDLSEMNSKTFQSWRSQLPGDPGRKVRGRFIGAAYPMLSHEPTQAERLFRMALRIRSLGDAERQQVRNAYEEWQKADDAIVDGAMKKFDELAAQRDMMMFGGAMADEGRTAMDVTAKRSETGTKALQSIAALIGDERMKKLYEKQSTPVEDVFAETGDPEAEGGAVEGPGGIGVRASAAEAQQFGSVRGFPGPIDVATIAVLARQLGVDSGKQALIEILHVDYVKRWGDTTGPIQERANSVQGKIYSNPGENEDPADHLATYFEACRSFMNTATEIDGAFLDNLAKAIDDEGNVVVALARLERTIGRASMPSTFTAFWGTSESAVNFIEVLRSADLPNADRAKAYAAIGEDIEPLIQTFLASARDEIELQREMAELNVNNLRLYRSAGEQANAAEMQRVAMAIMTTQQRSRALLAQRSEAGRASWNKAVAVLSEAQREALQLEYDQQAFPEIFSDPRSALPFLERADEMQDLTEAQRPQVAALKTRYQKEYIDFCRQMIPKSDAVPAVPTRPEDATEYWQQQMERENIRARIAFDRDERSHRTVSQLMRLLTEDQIKRIPGLSEYEKQVDDGRRGP
ncbi:MAG: hypothetical protein SGJ11_10675 [Phycisphaerae bacterium]|nr:hypothetical protein [Phycisphaerae bacterium]